MVSGVRYALRVGQFHKDNIRILKINKQKAGSGIRTKIQPGSREAKKHRIPDPRFGSATLVLGILITVPGPQSAKNTGHNRSHNNNKQFEYLKTLYLGFACQAAVESE
jgi:hypothetical protein